MMRARMRLEGEPDSVIGAGEAWFESGREPVLPPGLVRDAHDLHPLFDPAAGDPRSEAIMYVDPNDVRSTSRKYTVLVDEPIRAAALSD
jgi:hypothetical protein